MALWLSEVLWRSKSLQQVRAHQKISCLVVDIAGTASQPFGLQYLKSQRTQSRRHNQQRGLDARRVSCGEVSHFMCRISPGTRLVWRSLAGWCCAVLCCAVQQLDERQGCGRSCSGSRCNAPIVKKTAA